MTSLESESFASSSCVNCPTVSGKSFVETAALTPQEKSESRLSSVRSLNFGKITLLPRVVV